MQVRHALSAIVIITGCQETQERTPEREPQNERMEVATAEVDNTKKNQRDVDADVSTKTPFDQGENEKDRTITADIRKGVVGNEELSMNAKNVKIITNQGVVTLRGVVESQTEREAINTLAMDTSGVTRIDNQLEVAN